MRKKINYELEMKKKFEYILEVFARKGRTIAYSHFAEIAKFPHENLQDYKKLSHILSSIDREVYPKKGILPSAVVVREGCGVPGQGFFKNVMKMDIDIGYNEIIFYARELEKVFEYYSK